jgi:DNA invertase Pin-like site-specific DNA recombinase
VYARISDDREGAGAGVGRQEADARALAERLGWTVGMVIVENDVSAYKRRNVKLPDGRKQLRVIRPGFRQLLDLIDSGQVDGLITYDLDRTARDPRDLEDLIDAVEARHPRLPVESVTGSLRLANDSDVMMARVMVGVANKSSRDSSRRIKRKHDELAAAGTYAGGGARRFGYEADGVTIREDEADVIRSAAERVLSGETVGSVCRSLDADGIRPARAAKWSNRAMTDILRSPRIAGRRVHRGEDVGEATWPGIIDQQTHEALVGTLQARSKGAGKPALVRWCNHLLWCGHCGHYLAGTYMRPGHYTYTCRTSRGGCSRIAIHGPKVEAEIERQILGYLSRPDVLSALASGRTEDAGAETRAAIGEDESQLRELSRMWAQKAITLDEYSEARTIIEARIEKARGALLTVVPARVRAVVTASDQAATWAALDAPTRREVALAILKPAGYRGWTVNPADPRKSGRFDADRLELAPAVV